MRSFARSAVVLVAIAIAIAAWPTVAAAEEAPAGTAAALPPSALKEAFEANAGAPGAQLTDPAAASELPHSDLDREQVMELLEGVFGEALSEPAGIFAELEVEKLLSDHAALIQPTGTSAQSNGPVLLESTLPLAVRDPLGQEQPLDLELERSAEALEPATTLAPVEIPTELGQGISLPETGITISLESAAAERAPTVIGSSAAAYPNVAPDTDLVAAPTPTGLETFTSLRGADAPLTQTFDLTLPPGAALETAEDGGATVTLGGEAILRVAPPTAIDANGASVPTTLAVEGNSLTVTVEPTEQTSMPILVDPLYEWYEWANGHAAQTEGWQSYNNDSPWITIGGINGQPFFGNSNHSGLWMKVNPQTYATGAQAVWSHPVPHLEEFEAKGKYPESYITDFTISGLNIENSPTRPGAPFFFSGIFDPQTGAWVTNPSGQLAEASVPGTTAGVFNGSMHFTTGTPANYSKGGERAYGGSFAVSEPGWIDGMHQAMFEYSTMQIADEGLPRIQEIREPLKWMNTTATEPISFEATDQGLGLRYGVFSGLPGGSKGFANSCIGVTYNPCPSSWTYTLAASEYNPAAMPQGIDTYAVAAEDVVGNVSESPHFIHIKVDHTQPTVVYSGTLTEQATLGTTLPQYSLKAVARDGTAAAPQSGVASIEVKVDGKALESATAPGCATQNCSITREWTINSTALTAGSHTLEVVATDAVGLKSTEPPLKFTIGKDTTGPEIKATGAFFEGPEGWLEQKSYSANVSATDKGGYGVTSLNLKVDGSVVQSKTQSCKAGGCQAEFAKAMNMALYQGGAHTAEVIATDGAGNSTTKSWTINVDPSGAVPPTEAAETLEAMEDTEPETTVVAPTEAVISGEERAEGNNPGLKAEGGQIISTGVPVETTIASESGQTVTVESPVSAFEVIPIESSPTPEIVEEVAAVASGSGVNPIIRPKYNGFLDFQAIREVSAPEAYSWEVGMNPGQTLKEIEGGQAAAVYFEGGEEAMLIQTMPAVDAVGHAVPTHLEVSGKNILTLTVEHRKGDYVYPVVTGTAYEVGYITAEAILPQPPPPTEPPAQGAEGLELFGRASAPELLPMSNTDSNGATASAAHPHSAITYVWELCAISDVEVFGLVSGCDVGDLSLEARFEYNQLYAWWKEDKPHPKCPLTSHFASLSLTYCNWAGPNHQPYGGGYHITALARANNNGFFSATFTAPEHLSLYLYGDGYGHGHNTEHICNPLSVCEGG